MNGKVSVVPTTMNRTGTGVKPPEGPIFLNVTASIINNRINIQAWANVAGQTRHEVYEFDAKDDETFLIGSDYAPSTKNFLVGLGQKLMFLKRFGLEREP